MPLVHIVLFEFKPSTESDAIQDVGPSDVRGPDGGACAGSFKISVLAIFETGLRNGHLLTNGGIGLQTNASTQRAMYSSYDKAAIYTRELRG
jgi:hypothetical protein